MIPKRAIEKAIEGGWKDRLYRIYSGNTEVWTHYDSLILDPTFWQALGKALGWSKKRWARKNRAEWMANAFNFYGLILTGGHIADGRTCTVKNGAPCKCVEMFWKDILPDNE